MKKFFRSAAVFISLAVTAGLFAACGKDGNTDPTPPPSDGIQAGQEGWYVLESKTVQGVNTAEEYLYNCMYLKENAVSWYEIDYTGDRKSVV